MGSVLSSFNRSGLGAFRRSALGARGGIQLGPWFHAVLSAGNSRLRTSPDGLVFTTQAFNGVPVAVVGTRLFCQNGYFDAPYTTQVGFAGSLGGGGIQSNIVAAGNALICLSCATSGSAQTRNIARSTDGGATWAVVSYPSSSDAKAFNNVVSHPLLLASGRVIFIAFSLTGAPDSYYSCYSDDDGATWTGGASYTQNSTASVSKQAALFQRANGDVVDAGGNGTDVMVSSDDGVTFADSGFNTPAAVWDANGKRFYAKFGSTHFWFTNAIETTSRLTYCINDGASAGDYLTVATKGAGFLGSNNHAYVVDTSDGDLYESSDFTTWTALSTTPNPLGSFTTSRGRLIAVGAKG